MLTIQVQSPGLFTTVQDLGRYGYGPLGVSPSGAADPVAVRLGNSLVGNPQSAPILEMTLLGGAYVFSEDCLIALTGSDFGPSVDSSPAPMWSSHLVRAGQTLKIGPTKSGARCYLSVRGGIAVKSFLGSASTHILSRLGGIDGRPLRKGDMLSIHEAPVAPFKRSRSIPPEVSNRLGRRTTIRTTIAPQSSAFSSAATEAFYSGQYRVTEQSNRMGLRLEGPRLEAPFSGQMITEGVSLGAIQVPAGGQPIILFVEQQTTGGYPKIANVISADLASVGQLRPKDEIRFELVGPETAHALICEREKMLQELSSSFGTT